MRALIGFALGGLFLGGAYCFSGGCSNEGLFNRGETGSLNYAGNGGNISNREDCEAVNGEWRIWSRLDSGLARESCNIRASDSGARCSDSNECEGYCLAYDCINGGCENSEGICSSYREIFGCFSIVDRERGVMGICFD